MTARNAGTGGVLRLEWVLPGSRAAVYSALTDPEELRRWWGPRGFTTPSLKFEPRVGGGYRIEMQPPEGGAFHLLGEFREVDPPARLAYTFRWDPAAADDPRDRGHPRSRGPGEKTKLILTQGDFRPKNATRFMKRGGPKAWSA